MNDILNENFNDRVLQQFFLDNVDIIEGVLTKKSLADTKWYNNKYMVTYILGGGNSKLFEFVEQDDGIYFLLPYSLHEFYPVPQR